MSPTSRTNPVSVRDATYQRNTARPERSYTCMSRTFSGVVTVKVWLAGLGWSRNSDSCNRMVVSPLWRTRCAIVESIPRGSSPTLTSISSNSTSHRSQGSILAVKSLPHSAVKPGWRIISLCATYSAVAPVGIVRKHVLDISEADLSVLNVRGVIFYSSPNESGLNVLYSK